ncbi:hypothetical protein AAFC00_003551 [Neodothiora populina]|uniref:Voltage-gated hydrogen channel 1 n=1 Tax=Neodothiora populina TaxID=2781224 RepID=A0ABR3PF02_9PEZI
MDQQQEQEEERQSLLPSSPSTDYAPPPSPILPRLRKKTKSFLDSKWGHYSILLLVSLDVTSIFAEFIVQIFTCEGRIERAEGETTLEALSVVGLVFSCVFVLELGLSLWTLGFSYFHSKFRCFDAVVILTSFVIDVLLRGVLEEVASIVIVLRLWRVFKIIEELGVSAQDHMEELQTRLEAAEKENDRLRRELDK